MKDVLKIQEVKDVRGVEEWLAGQEVQKVKEVHKM